MNSKKYPVSRKDNLVIQELPGEVLIYDMKENKAFCLNETSALVWQACDGKNSISDISKFVGEKLQSPANDDLVWFAIDQLKKEKLIENESELTDQFAGMARREVIKKIGLGSMIVLPIVATIVAPVAYAANSTCGTSCMCNNASAWAVGGICTQGSGGNMCPATPTSCNVCRAIAPGGSNSPGMCHFA